MTAKFAPGPWIVVGHENDLGEWSSLEIREKRDRNLAVCFLTSDGPKEANAALIADAPAMYALLEQIVESASCPDALDSAINRAEALLERHQS